MFLPTPDEDPLPGAAINNPSRDYFDWTCHFLDRQCDEGGAGESDSIWKGVDVNGIALSELPVFLGAGDMLYDGPFLRFCKKVVKKGKYKRFGNEDDVFNLRLKVVSGQDDYDSLTILLQHEYIGYDVSIEGADVVLRRTGSAPEVLDGDRAIEVLDDIEYVAMRLIEYSCQTQASSRMEVCDSQAPSVTSEALANRPKRNLARRVLGLLLT